MNWIYFTWWLVHMVACAVVARTSARELDLLYLVACPHGVLCGAPAVGCVNMDTAQLCPFFTIFLPWRSPPRRLMHIRRRCHAPQNPTRPIVLRGKAPNRGSVLAQTPNVHSGWRCVALSFSALREDKGNQGLGWSITDRIHTPARQSLLLDRSPASLFQKIGY